MVNPVAGAIGRQRSTAVGLVAVLGAAVMFMLLAGAPTAGADGVLKPGNQNCADIIPGSKELRINAPADGTFSSGDGFSVVVDIRNLTADDPDHAGDQTGSQVFDFDATGGSVIGVAVKGGPDTNFYDYRPGGTTSDDGLHAPVNSSNQRFYGLSHISFCYLPVGALKIVKFIDADEDGIDDGEADPAGEGFTFTVRGPAPSTAIVCSGSTDASGELVCPNLAAGTYEITETQKNGFTNTTSLVVSAGVVAGQTTTKTFGNRCLITKVFEVRSVPAGTTGVFARYTITAGPGTSATPVTVDLVNVGGGVWRGTAPNTFSINNTISWSWGINKGLANEASMVVGSESFAGAGYPACTKTNLVTFPNTPINGVKYKDENGDGIRQADEDTPLAGFNFQLKQGTTVLDTDTSDASGEFSFAPVGPGTYTVVEVGKDGTTLIASNWEVTAPTGGSTTFSVGLGDPAKNLVFLNAPLYSIDLDFNDLTGFTDAVIVCKDKDGNVIGSQTGDHYDANSLNLRDSRITCTFDVTDP